MKKRRRAKVQQPQRRESVLVPADLDIYMTPFWYLSRHSRLPNDPGLHLKIACALHFYRLETRGGITAIERALGGPVFADFNCEYIEELCRPYGVSFEEIDAIEVWANGEPKEIASQLQQLEVYLKEFVKARKEGRCPPDYPVR
jgi:hypothetical protein